MGVAAMTVVGQSLGFPEKDSVGEFGILAVVLSLNGLDNLLATGGKLMKLKPRFLIVLASLVMLAGVFVLPGRAQQPTVEGDPPRRWAHLCWLMTVPMSATTASYPVALCDWATKVGSWSESRPSRRMVPRRPRCFTSSAPSKLGLN